MAPERPQANESFFDPVDLKLKQVSGLLSPLVELEHPRESVVWKAFCDRVDLEGARHGKSHHTAASMLSHVFSITTISETIRKRRNEDDEYDRVYEMIENFNEDLIFLLKNEKRLHRQDAPLRAYSQLSEMKKEYKKKFEARKMKE